MKVAYLSIALPTSEQIFTKHGRMSEVLAGTRKKKMNETQPLSPKKSESSWNDLYGSEIIIYEEFWGKGGLYLKKDKSPYLGYKTT